MALDGDMGEPGGGGLSTERRMLIAVALSIGVMLAWSMLFPPGPKGPPPPPRSTASQPATEAQTEAPRELAPLTPAEESADAPVDAVVEAAAEEQLHIETDLFEVTLSNRGAVSTSWKLRRYTTPDGAPLELWPPFTDRQNWPLAIETVDASLTQMVNGALFATAVEHGDETQRVVFTWADGRGLEVRKTLTFRQDSYLVDVEASVIDRGRRLPVRLMVGPGFSAQELRDGRSNYYYSGTALWNVGGQVTHTKPNKLPDGGGLGGANWAGLEDQFFTALILPTGGPAEVSWTSVKRTPVPEAGSDETPKPIDEPILGVAIGEEGARLFVGPKQYTMLRDLGSQLDRAVWFSSYGWLAWIVKHLYLALVWLNDRITHNYGWAIVLATFVLRIVLFPVNQYAMVSMKRSQMQMQRLQPKVKGIRAKYKKSKDIQSRQAMNQEMMDLYKREGVNPMGGVTGCLPMFAQFPILIGFYNMLTVAVELRGAPFMFWIQDLSVKDPYWISPLLMGATMFIQQKMAMTKITDPQQLQQQRIMLFMPIMFTFICLQMPSGLVIYWFVNNLLGMGQQWLVNRRTSQLEPEEPVVKKPRRAAAGRKG